MATLTLQAPAYVGMSTFATSVNMNKPKTSHCYASLARRGVIRNSRILQSNVSTLSSPSTSLGFVSSSITETRLRVTQMDVSNLGNGCRGGASGAVCSLPASPETLRWVFMAASAVLMFVKSVGIQRQLLVPLVAIEIPRQALGWFKGDYGLWAAFVAIAVKLFYYIPGELELPLYLLLLVITAPFQVTQYRGTPAAGVATLGIAACLGSQHFQTSGSVKGAFQSEKIFPSIAIVLLVIIPILFLVNGMNY